MASNALFRFIAPRSTVSGGGSTLPCVPKPIGNRSQPGG